MMRTISGTTVCEIGVLDFPEQCSRGSLDGVERCTNMADFAIIVQCSDDEPGYDSSVAVCDDCMAVDVRGLAPDAIRRKVALETLVADLHARSIEGDEIAKLVYELAAEAEAGYDLDEAEVEVVVPQGGWNGIVCGPGIHIPSGETFTVKCVKVGRRAGTLYSKWSETNEEGITTEIKFRYPDCNSLGDKVGDRITFTMHTDERGFGTDSTADDTVEAS